LPCKCLYGLWMHNDGVCGKTWAYMHICIYACIHACMHTSMMHSYMHASLAKYELKPARFEDVKWRWSHHDVLTYTASTIVVSYDCHRATVLIVCNIASVTVYGCRFWQSCKLQLYWLLHKLFQPRFDSEQL